MISTVRFERKVNSKITFIVDVRFQKPNYNFFRVRTTLKSGGRWLSEKLDLIIYSLVCMLAFRNMFIIFFGIKPSFLKLAAVLGKGPSTNAYEKAFY